MTGWKLGHRPGLDGLRGVAVLLVLLAHGEVPETNAAGIVGVTVFFVLSGFLITTLLLEETDRTGKVSFLGFYERRARRLLPALVVTVAIAVTIGAFVDGFAPWNQTWGTLLYANNWVLAGDVELRNALSHTWSLSIEEQFYFVAPLMVLALRRRPHALLAASVVGVAVVVGLRLILLVDGLGKNLGHLYYGTDTRADALLIGVGLAAACRIRPLRAPNHMGLAAAYAILVLCVLMGVYSDGAMLLLPILVGYATVSLLCHGIHGGFRAPWLQWVGRRSYGIYLYHFPIVVALKNAEVPWPVILPIVVPTSLAIAAFSWRYLERPFLLSRARDDEEASKVAPASEADEPSPASRSVESVREQTPDLSVRRSPVT